MKICTVCNQRTYVLLNGRCYSCMEKPDKEYTESRTMSAVLAHARRVGKK